MTEGTVRFCQLLLKYRPKVDKNVPSPLSHLAVGKLRYWAAEGYEYSSNLCCLLSRNMILYIRLTEYLPQGVWRLERIVDNIFLLFFIYFILMNLIAVALTVYDKKSSQKKNNASRRRIKELTLLMASILGGSVAMFLTMLVIRHKTRHVKFMAGLPLMIALQVAFITIAFNNSLTVSHYTVETDKIDGQIKLALIADLHSCDYSSRRQQNQNELIYAIEMQQPDAILLCGDIFDDKLPPDNAIEFISRVSVKFPCYYVSGNHEFWSGIADNYKRILMDFGVVILEGSAEILETRGDKIRIAGIDDPDTDHFASSSAPYSQQLDQLNAMSMSFDNDIFTVLLSHRPERINELLPLNTDLVLSGHAHGGQWRFPIFLENGALSPNQGLFPKYASGEQSFGATKLIISRGLARETTTVPRIFNPPEVIIITLKAMRLL